MCFREVGIIAGSVVGVVVFFGIAVTLISCCCCHRIERQGYVKVNEGNASISFFVAKRFYVVLSCSNEELIHSSCIVFI